MTWWARLSTLLLAVMVMAVLGTFLGFLWTGAQLSAGRPGLVLLTSTLDTTEPGRLLATGTAVAAILVALIAVVGSWTRSHALIANRSSEARESVRVSKETLAHHVADAALAAEHVQRARASVMPDGSGSVAIGLDVQIDDDAEAGSVVSGADHRVASALEARYGIRMSKQPNVEVRHVGRRRGRAAHVEGLDRPVVAPGERAESGDTPGPRA